MSSYQNSNALADGSNSNDERKPDNVLCIWFLSNGGLPERATSQHRIPVICSPQYVVRKIACGSTIAAFLTDLGTVFTWFLPPKRDASSDLGKPKPLNKSSSYVIDIACGKHHVACLTDVGEVLLQGCNHNGQLGIGEADETEPTMNAAGAACLCGQRTLPTNVESIRDVFLLSFEEPIQKVACAALATLFLTKNGFLWGTGLNVGGWEITTEKSPSISCGRSRQRNRKYVTPQLLHMSGGPYIPSLKDIVAGDTHFLTLTTTNDVYAWGSNLRGEIGNGRTASCAQLPVQVFPTRPTENAGPVVFIAASIGSLLVTAKGSMYMWGFNGWKTPTIVTPMIAPKGWRDNFVALTKRDLFVIKADGSLQSGSVTSLRDVGTTSNEVEVATEWLPSAAKVGILAASPNLMCATAQRHICEELFVNKKGLTLHEERRDATTSDFITGYDRRLSSDDCNHYPQSLEAIFSNVRGIPGISGNSSYYPQEIAAISTTATEEGLAESSPTTFANSPESYLRPAAPVASQKELRPSEKCSNNAGEAKMIESLQLEIKSWEKRYEEQKVEFNKMFESYQADLIALTQQLEERKSAVPESQLEMDSSSPSKEERDDNNILLTTEIETLKVELADIERKYREVCLENELFRKKEQSSRLPKVQNNVIDLMQRDLENEDLKNQIAALHRHLEKSASRNRTLELAIEDAERSALPLKLVNEGLKEENSKLHRDLKELEEAMRAATQEALTTQEQLTKQGAATDYRVNQLQLRVDKLTEENRRLQKLQARDTVELKECRAERERLAERCSLLQAEVDTQAKQIKDSEKAYSETEEKLLKKYEDLLLESGQQAEKYAQEQKVLQEDFHNMMKKLQDDLTAAQCRYASLVMVLRKAGVYNSEFSPEKQSAEAIEEAVRKAVVKHTASAPTESVKLLKAKIRVLEDELSKRKEYQ